MEFFFRVDFSKKTGSGHLARCSYLSSYIERTSTSATTFISDSESGSIPPFIKLSKIKYINFKNWSEDAEETIKILNASPTEKVLIVDSYNLDSKWESIVRPHVKRIVVIDDLANRSHSCDILIDCGHHRTISDYSSIVEEKTKLLLGLNFCPISQNFTAIEHADPLYKRVHLFFGSTVAFNTLYEYYQALSEIFADYSFNLAYSSELTPEIGYIWSKRTNAEDKLFCSEPLYHSLAGCTLAIGSPGVAVWERAFLGIPGLYISVNSNQIDVIRDLESMNYCKYIGVLEDLRINVQKINEYVRSGVVEKLRANIQGTVDGQGLQRIVAEINNEL